MEPCRSGSGVHGGVWNWFVIVVIVSINSSGIVWKVEREREYISSGRSRYGFTDSFWCVEMDGDGDYDLGIEYGSAHGTDQGRDQDQGYEGKGIG
jgi:hypothetical protein